MPWLTKDVEIVLNLYQRCKVWNRLPAEGSVMEQPYRLMELFDALDSMTAQKREDELQKTRMGHGN